jgi:uncharacterized protein YdeI (YjbR/CyaY-like superfamily)
METYQDLPVQSFATQPEWLAWLAEHHDSGKGIWIKFAKKASGIPTITYDQALEDALCYGWIDGQTKGLDETYYLQKFTPRRPKSIWSKRNVGIVDQLIEAGRMQPAGQAAIDAAKADGRWDRAYDSSSNMIMPDDLQAALDANPKAKAFYETLNKTNTYAILWRIQTAKKPETRAARIQKLVAMLERGEKLH